MANWVDPLFISILFPSTIDALQSRPDGHVLACLLDCVVDVRSTQVYRSRM